MLWPEAHFIGATSLEFSLLNSNDQKTPFLTVYNWNNDIDETILSWPTKVSESAIEQKQGLGLVIPAATPRGDYWLQVKATAANGEEKIVKVKLRIENAFGDIVKAKEKNRDMEIGHGDFWKNHSATYNNTCHDYSTAEGTSIYAPVDGTLTFKQAYRVYDSVKYLTSYGNHVEIESADGRFKMIFCHLKEFVGCEQALDVPDPSYTKQESGSTGKFVSDPITVTAGQLIAKSGETGYAIGAHIHIEIHYCDDKGNWVYLYPCEFLNYGRVVLAPTLQNLNNDPSRIRSKP